VSDGGTPLFSKTWDVAGKPLRTGNALRFTVKASSGIPAGNLIAVTLTSINGSPVNTTLQTDGSGSFSQAQAVYAGSSLAQGFSVQGTVRLSFTGSYPPLGSRLNFLATAGNVSCAQAGAPTAEIAYIQPDHLGSPRTVTDAQQRVIWKWDQQDPFGGNVPQQDPDGDGTSYTLNLRFPGHYFDQETGLHYNYYRDYDPATGRYIQSDPIGLGGGVNTYAYADLSPLTTMDPLGLCPPQFDFGWTEGKPWVEKNTPTPGRYSMFQYQSRWTGNLIQAHGSCDCGKGVIDCDYVVFFESADRERPYDQKKRRPAGAWSNWEYFPQREMGSFRLQYDCEKKVFQAKGAKRL
jgi:RHS repeat-associated protein